MSITDQNRSTKSKGKVRNSGFAFLRNGSGNGRGHFLVTILLSGLISFPLVSLIVIAFSGDGESMAHILKNVLPRVGTTTILLLLQTGILVAFAGFITAWLVSFYDFPGRNIFSWAMMLPFAVPTYLAAYGFVEFFSFTGPIQSFTRYLTGYTSMREYWSLDIRTLWGTALVLSLVLYPYVYMTVRTLFHFQGGRVVEAARCAGAGPVRILFRILLPLARPAIVLGVTLALMEVINDIGAMEHLGVETLTFSVFSVWLNQNDLAGAAQLSLFLLVIVFALIMLERWARRGRQFFDNRATNTANYYRREKLGTGKSLLAFGFCLMPILLGFGIPFFVMGGYALKNIQYGIDPALWPALSSSMFFAGTASIITLIFALLLVYSARLSRNRGVGLLVRISSIGYAIPGTIIALGIFLPLASADNWIATLARDNFGVSTGLLITGSGATMVFAYIVRFMAMGEGAIDNGFRKISPNIDMASRSLGKTALATLTKVMLPILRPAIATGFLLVFIESLKELSATITLRPFGVNTLSTYIYDYASRSLVEEAGLASLIIMAAGIIPVILVTRTMLEK